MTVATSTPLGFSILREAEPTNGRLKGVARMTDLPFSAFRGKRPEVNPLGGA